jgi:putative flippase GtrA
MGALVEQFLRFGGVGVLAAVGHYGTLIGAVELAGTPPVPATLAGYLVGGIVSYVLNRCWTFASDARHREAVGKFVLVAAVGFVLTGAMMALLTGPLAIHYLPAQIATTLVVMLWSFWANKLWTFARRSGA